MNQLVKGALARRFAGAPSSWPPRRSSPSAGSTPPAWTASPRGPRQQGDDLLPLRQQARALPRGAARHVSRGRRPCAAIADGPGLAEDKLDAWIAAIVEEAAKRPWFPPIALRELGSGAPHIDNETFGMMNGVYLGARDVIVQGQTRGTFRQADPLLTYFTIMPSILMFFARQRRAVAAEECAGRRGGGTARDQGFRSTRADCGTRHAAQGSRMKTTATSWLVAIGFVLIAGSVACREPEPSNTTRVSGHVEATEVRVAPDVGGRLIELRVMEGDRVAAGDLIGRLDATDTELQIARARADRAAADAQLRALQAGARPEEIRQAQAEVEAAEAEAAGANAELKAAETDLERFEAAPRERRRRRSATMPERASRWRRSGSGAHASAHRLHVKSSLDCKGTRRGRSRRGARPRGRVDAQIALLESSPDARSTATARSSHLEARGYGRADGAAYAGGGCHRSR